MATMGPEYKAFRKKYPRLCLWVSLKFQLHLFLLEEFGVDILNDCGELVKWGGD